MQVIGMSILVAVATTITAIVFISVKSREEKYSICTKSNEADFCADKHAQKVNRIAKQLRERRSVKPV